MSIAALFVPAMADRRRVPIDGALVVNRTRDRGKTFETLREGLLSADCYDRAYRHGLEAGGDGLTLTMGSTTGGLWSSLDGGDHWQAVSMSVPPIYTVRIG